MNVYFFIGLFVLTVCACQSQPAQVADNSLKNELPSASNFPVEQKNERKDKNLNELTETFSDEKNVGARGKNKIEISLTKKTDYSSDVELKFYSLGGDNKWKLKQKTQLQSGSNRLDIKLSDFNNDGLNDLTYISDLAARGANEIRTLFIYDKSKDELVHIKNSEEYPNLFYNKTLNCLDAQRFYGGTATDFAKIEGDILKTFAVVETVGEERKVYTVDKNGERKLLRTDKVSANQLFERYKTFDPPRIYTARELER